MMEEYVLQNLDDINRVLQGRVGDATTEPTPDIQRVPEGLACIGKDGGHYVVPRAVPIGPYYRHSPKLQFPTKIMKMTAVGWFLSTARAVHPPEFVVDKALEIIATPPGPRIFYDDRFEHIEDKHFASWMFQDGCFLMAFMMAMSYGDDDDGSSGGDATLQGLTAAIFQPRIDSIMRDIMLLENQIPWWVLEVLMEFLPVPVPIDRFLSRMAATFDVRTSSGSQHQRAGAGSEAGGTRYKPPHLLALFRRHQVGPLPAELGQRRISVRPSSTFSTAMELAEMGVQLNASETGRFGDMGIRAGRIFGKLGLAPVFLNDLTACWLVNMAAYEVCAGRWADDYAVSSYLSLLALLMNREDDVHELRTRRIVHSTFSNPQTLEFFKGLAPHLHFGRRYYSIFEELQAYRQGRPIFVAVHKFLYNNFKAILTVFSIIGVVVPILQAFFAKQH
ncbi:hypothetical protein ACP70R_048559 [Stipagrostis hirtigluma subsp. patula]